MSFTLVPTCAFSTKWTRQEKQSGLLLGLSKSQGRCVHGWGWTWQWHESDIMVTLYDKYDSMVAQQWLECDTNCILWHDTMQRYNDKGTMTVSTPSVSFLLVQCEWLTEQQAQNNGLMCPLEQILPSVRRWQRGLFCGEGGGEGRGNNETTTYDVIPPPLHPSRCSLTIVTSVSSRLARPQMEKVRHLFTTVRFAVYKDVSVCVCVCLCCVTC